MIERSLFSDIYRGKRVLVTGHTGFKGSWLSLWLTNLGAEVIGYSINIPTKPSHFELLNLDMTSISGDVLDKKKIIEAVKQYRPDVVFHMAAQPLVRASYAVPVETFEVNIMGTVNVLEACRQSADVRAIVNITSDKCYQNNETGQAYKETDAMGGYDPYSASKGAAEIVANSYRNSFFHPNDYGKMHNVLLADVRAGNVIGGGDWATDRLIPDLAKAASQGKTVAIRSPYAVRPWQHVLEPLSGYLLIGQRLLEEKAAFADNWNFGPSNNATMTVGRVVELASNSWESIKYSVEASPVSVHEAQLLTLDSTKARNQLQWSSIWDTDATVSKAVDWYKRYYTANEITSLEDLTAYIDDAVLRDAVWTKSAIESRNDD